DEARRVGYEEGRRLAADEAQAAARRAAVEFEERVRDAVAFLENAALFVRAQLSDELDRLAKGATSLALGLTEAILQRELALSDDPGAEAITRALALVPSDAAAIARCNPEDLGLIGEIDSDTLKLVPDDSVGRGGCLLDTGSTLVDARIETALARVREILDIAGSGRDE
ncbi:MAG TPA: FliH/SctL family protein, partial [Acidimicrobiales bacterium]|nr:FliH/SctL family protein [Acidimicrobiales bacterium]